MLKGIKQGGTFLFNSIWDVEETKNRLPDHMKKTLAEKNIRFYMMNATEIAEEIGLGGRTNTTLQSAFFKIANVIPFEIAVGQMKDAVKKSFGMKGEAIVAMNMAAIDRGGDYIEVPIPAEWKSIKLDKPVDTRDIPAFIKDVVEPINGQRGDDLPVSAFLGREDGTFPSGTTKFEKRGIAVNVPEWQVGSCIQCNQCAYVCPHAAIRPFLMTADELAAAPAGTASAKGTGGTKEYQFRMQVSVLDCTGCGNCADVCPSKEKSLIMKPLGTQMEEVDRWTYMHEKVGYKDTVLAKEKSVKNSQFAQPLFEFSGACAGCGETPYIKLITQLYGERMIVSNATGCSSIYGGSAPSTPYTANAQGKGPAWANSLFEDNAEYGYGMSLAVNKLRDRIAIKMTETLDAVNETTREAFGEWLAAREKANESQVASEKVMAALKSESHPIAADLIPLEQYLVKKSIWIFGGDGWAYDIGYGGLDHVLASGEDINVLVVDTEVYSNTGGQSSKSTPIAAIAKFAASGKKIRKKDLGMMAMSYGYVYVAQVAMGSSQNQFMKALKEAEAYPGPSIIIAYSPCISHGLRIGMGQSQYEQELAVKSGYWSNFRYNPLLEAEGKNPFELDSKEPDWNEFKNFLMGEVRFSSLKKAFPEVADELFSSAEEAAKWRYRSYQRMASMDFTK
jgi:pyruvate-ferredoxin/flavodoxin oxidoreductase